MKLRNLFLALLALGILWAVPVDAQQTRRASLIGILAPASPSVGKPYVEALRQGLRELGYIEGRNIAIEYRWTEGKPDRFPDLAAELVHLKVDVIVAVNVPAIVASKQATATIPIVMVLSHDPVRMGLVASLARPGANVTGLASLIPELGGKRLELLKEVVPRARSVAVLWNSSVPGTHIDWEQTQAAAQALKIRLQSVEVRSRDDFEHAFSAIAKQRPDALVTVPDVLTSEYRAEIVDFAARNRLPAVYGTREFVEAGGLMAYSTSVRDLFRRAAYFVDRILKGAKPADLPVEQPMRFELVINAKTAKALGLTIPQSILIRADQVIQ